MKKTILLNLIFFLGLVLITIFSLPTADSAQRIHYSTLFNPNSVTTISGEVVRVLQVPSGNGTDMCIQAVIRTPAGETTTVLGPKTYMTKQKLNVAPKDRLTITGSAVSIMGKPFILATEVKGDRTMKLRAPNGRPVWAVGDDWHVP